MKKLLIAPLFLLASCEQALDGHRYTQTEFEHTTVEIEVVAYPTITELRRAGNGIGIQQEGKELMAFAVIDPIHPKCTMHIVEPAKNYSPEWIGHEFTHCIRGRWHN